MEDDRYVNSLSDLYSPDLSSYLCFFFFFFFLLFPPDTGAWKRTPISVSFDTLGFRVRAPGDLSDTELDDALDILTERASSQQHMGLCQLEKIHTALTEVVLDSVRQCRELTEDIMNKSESLKVTIREYFQSENPMEKVDLKLEVNFNSKLTKRKTIYN